ncbi:adenylosuccinate lyase [Sporobacter termitidis DSM 10068]|uniref:Adenylosuccinate lyase n=1 Tax=Sporobacter termitidis DSM 10068 TaxID=1123282 RepID=A0A1M5TRX1_9FIRM|nr:adenylosuccinate lyase [Sporobacter termitidis]SHH53410.1 adenylosuccinate lyase [Sporobacter termitidis DSM 10068]
MPTNTYESPLSSRYASDEMLYLFSADKKFSTWRKLWVALARAEKELGLNITDAQISEMEAHLYDIDYAYAARMEKELRHDVMAHVHAFGKVCPLSFPIIHLGATSCYVGDNTDVILMREGLQLIRTKLLRVIARLSDFADKYKALPTLGFTHFQPAQLTTVGKRAALWLNELIMDLDELEFRITSLKLLGSKGTTGTQASFMELFDGDHEKIKKMEARIAREMGFDGVVPVSGQTYSRKMDAGVLNTLSGIAQSAAKFATDMRLLSHLKELEEPFEGKQIGSSAMPYKRNPMRCERICSLARYVITDAQNAALTTYNQWFERTLDDSANKRISVPEAFLAVDAILNIYLNVAAGIKVYPKVIDRHIQDELPFMATENIMMKAVKKGGNRQELHEAIRVHSVAAGNAVKELGLPNDLIARIAGDPLFGLTESEIRSELDPAGYIGRAPEQVDEFLRDVVRPRLSALDSAELGTGAELKV